MKQGEIPLERGVHLMQEEDMAGLYSALRRYGRFLAQDYWDGDDLAQEAVIRAFASYPASKINQALLKRIAYNCWMDIVRKRKQEVLVETPEHVWKERERQVSSSVDRLLNRLTLKQAVIFTLKEGFRYKTKEIAEIMNTTEYAVKSSLNRARKQLNYRETDEKKAAFSNEEEEKVSQLLQESLAMEDPSILIKAIPGLHSLKSNSEWKPVLSVKSPPSNTLCMAA
ncbi:hypothetical protein J7I93_06080 [Bacillus sp. ISL-47]|uniref:sigma factor-like helix-turn-helix DNA-binding protein n=1 Tax=Bacillus sp. ISL-47 TaxID=2819130 RepID=UPI001BEA9B6C|nr:sigma factor-like helix-turn-helix DNA-binding protein [Bacillus sp. ISL-47]MBT2687739.1 hypothetical protein [Bacillus sp. ISL-47]